MRPTLFITSSVRLHCFNFAKSWLRFLLEVGSILVVVLVALLIQPDGFHYHTSVFCLAGLESFFPFPVFFTSLDPKEKRVLAKLDCIALADVKEATLLENLITPLARGGWTGIT